RAVRTSRRGSQPPTILLPCVIWFSFGAGLRSRTTFTSSIVARRKAAGADLRSYKGLRGGTGKTRKTSATCRQNTSGTTRAAHLGERRAARTLISVKARPAATDRQSIAGSVHRQWFVVMENTGSF